jgi:hypothetical protein
LQQQGLLLDHLIGAQQDRCRDVDLQRLGGLEIDRQFKPGRLFDRKIGWISPRKIRSAQVASRK